MGFPSCSVPSLWIFKIIFDHCIRLDCCKILGHFKPFLHTCFTHVYIKEGVRGWKKMKCRGLKIYYDWNYCAPKPRMDVAIKKWSHWSQLGIRPWVPTLQTNVLPTRLQGASSPLCLLEPKVIILTLSLRHRQENTEPQDWTWAQAYRTLWAMNRFGTYTTLS